MPSVPKGPGPHMAHATVDEWSATLRSIQGRVRRRLEDAWAIETDASLDRRRVHAFAVFDGLGGMPRGQEAAWEAAGTLRGTLGGSTSPENALGRLNDRVIATRGSTTAVIALIMPDAPAESWLVTVGDSSAYRLGDEGAVRVNPLDADGPKTVTDFLGNPAIGGHFMPLDLAPGETLLLCTDGVDGVVEHDELERALKAGEPKAALERLIGQADAAGSPDNATAMLLRRTRQP